MSCLINKILSKNPSIRAHKKNKQIVYFTTDPNCLQFDKLLAEFIEKKNKAKN